VLTGIAIKDFRAFDSLELDGFGQVNLIVGQNNAGKTCLLEALVVAVTHGEMQPSLPWLFRERDSGAEESFLHWLIRDRSQEALLRPSADTFGWEVAITRGERVPSEHDARRWNPRLAPSNFHKTISTQDLSGFSSFFAVAERLAPLTVRVVPAQVA
jgi:hypothetical protein